MKQLNIEELKNIENKRFYKEVVIAQTDSKETDEKNKEISDEEIRNTMKQVAKLEKDCDLEIGVGFGLHTVGVSAKTIKIYHPADTNNKMNVEAEKEKQIRDAMEQMGGLLESVCTQNNFDKAMQILGEEETKATGIKQKSESEKLEKKELPNNEEVVKSKDEKLKEKVDTLLEKIEIESNPISRGIIAAKLKWLSAKMQKEIEIQDIKENAQNERNDIQDKRKERFQRNLKQKIEIVHEINELEKKLEKNKKFDPQSSEFKFKREFEKMNSDVEQLLASLEHIGTPKAIQASEMIRETIKDRKIYNGKEEEIKFIDSMSEFNENVANQDEKESKKNEKALVRQTAWRNNIFTRLFQSIKEGLKERKKTKELQKSMKDKEKEINEDVRIKQAEKNDREAINKHYDDKIAELKEIIAELEAKRDVDLNIYDKKVKQSKQNFIDKSTEDFRKQMYSSEAAENAADVVKKFAEKKEIAGQDEKLKNIEDEQQQ